MKAKINIEMFDDSSRSQFDEVGITDKFLELCYHAAFEQFVKDMCKDGLKYTIVVEIEDNTVN